MFLGKKWGGCIIYKILDALSKCCHMSLLGSSGRAVSRWKFSPAFQLKSRSKSFANSWGGEQDLETSDEITMFKRSVARFGTRDGSI